jgi:GNAT superfamily N-acetyltransferase
VTVRTLQPEDSGACDAIVAGLPEWFGNEQGLEECASAVRSHAGLAALDGDDVVGFLTWEPRDEGIAEITWMAVRADRRRTGAGRELVGVLAERLIEQGVIELRVKTLSARDPYPPYAETRTFYRSMGFAPVEEFDTWGPENPGVVMARRL